MGHTHTAGRGDRAHILDFFSLFLTRWCVCARAAGVRGNALWETPHVSVRLPRAGRLPGHGSKRRGSSSFQICWSAGCDSAPPSGCVTEHGFVGSGVVCGYRHKGQHLFECNLLGSWMGPGVLNQFFFFFFLEQGCGKQSRIHRFHRFRCFHFQETVEMVGRKRSKRPLNDQILI